MSKKRKIRMIRLSTFFLLAIFFGTTAGCKHLMALLNATFEKPTMTFQRMHLRNVNFKGMDMDFEFNLKNPNGVGVTLSKIIYQLDLDGNTLFKGTSSRSIEVKPNGTSPVRLPFGVEFAKFVKSLLVFFQKRDYVPYKLTTAFGIQTPIGEVVIPINKADRVPIPKLPDIKLGKVDVRVVKTTKSFLGQTVSIPTGAQIDLKVNLKQKGKFPVKLQGLNYNVSMGGSSLLRARTKTNSLKVGGTQQVNIPIRLGKQQAITLIRAIVNKRFNLKLNGALDLGVFKLPLNFDASKSKNLNLPELGPLTSLLKFIN